jgi:hypothetical protein
MMLEPLAVQPLAVELQVEVPVSLCNHLQFAFRHGATTVFCQPHSHY